MFLGVIRLRIIYSPFEPLIKPLKPIIKPFLEHRWRNNSLDQALGFSLIHSGYLSCLEKISKENNSFNFVNTYYTTDLFLMYLSLNIVFYNFINCVQSKPPKNKLKMNL